MRLKNGYYLAFRATARVNVSVYDAYNSPTHHDDDGVERANIPCGCMTMGLKNCDRHYRSKILDLWNDLPIVKVCDGKVWLSLCVE